MRTAMIGLILLALPCTAAWGQGQTSDRAFGQVVTIEITGVADEIQKDKICRRVPQLMPPGEYITRFGSVEDGKMWAKAAPVPNVQAFAAKIDFGKVTAIRERTIYVTATPIYGAGTAAASPVNRALEGLKAMSANTRHSALEQLISMKPNKSQVEVVKALKGQLSGSDERAKTLAVKALGTWSGREITPALLKLLDSKDHRDVSPRNAAIEVLTQFRDPASIEPIARQLANVSNRSAAVRALKAYGRKAEKATLSMLNNKDGDTRIAAVEVLEKIGTKASEKPLEGLTKDANKRLSAAATKSLKAVKKRVA